MRPFWMPKFQTSMPGGSTPRLVIEPYVPGATVSRPCGLSVRQASINTIVDQTW